MWVFGGGAYEVVNTLLLEQLVTPELERALEKVTRDCWSETRQQRSGTLGGDNLAETTDHALVVDCWLELDSRLNAAGKVES